MFPEIVRSRLWEIYEKFFGENAKFDLNITDKTRKKVVETFQMDVLCVEVFDRARDEVFEIMFWGVYPRYLKWCQKGGSNTRERLVKSGRRRRVTVGDGEKKSERLGMVREMDLAIMKQVLKVEKKDDNMKGMIVMREQVKSEGKVNLLKRWWSKAWTRAR